MSDLGKYIEKRKKTDRDFAKGFQKGYERFKSETVRKKTPEKHEKEESADNTAYSPD